MRQGYQRFGELAQQAGLRWGGAWKRFQDMPYVEMRSECLVAIRSCRAGQPMLVAEVVPEPVGPLAPMWHGLMRLAITPATLCGGWMCAGRWGWSLSVASVPMGYCGCAPATGCLVAMSRQLTALGCLSHVVLRWCCDAFAG